MLVELIQNSRFKALRRMWLQMLRYYFRVEVEGMDYVPSRGGCLIVSNHSGYSGADALILGHMLKRGTRRRPRFLAHRAFFDFSARIREISEFFGLKKASIEVGVDILKKERLVIIFPEGESGNFKPSVRRYRLQRFHTGYLRMALTAQVPVIPSIVIGAEESYLNLGNINLTRYVKGLRIPLPVNLLPLPAKWKIVFFPPIQPGELAPKGMTPEQLLGDDRALKLVAYQLQRRLQRELIHRVHERPYIYTRESRKVFQALQQRISPVLRRRKKK